MFSNAKKNHFKGKLTNVYRKIWDMEFLMEQQKLTREGFRVEYDRLKELQDAANVRIATEKEKEDPDKTIIEQLEKLIERYSPDMQQLAKQMDQMDIMIQGPSSEEERAKMQQPPTNEVISNLQMVVSLLKEKINKL